MNKLYFTFLLLIITGSVKSQYCTSGGPTTLDDSNVESVNLTGDGSSISFTACPGVLGVQDLTSLSTTLTAGNSYTIDIQFGTCDGNFQGVGEAWIDFNGNQIFEPSESLGTWSGTPPTALSSFNFQVPLTITNITTRLRIVQYESGNLPIDPCASFQWGSVMDFTINLTGGVDCSGYVGNDTDDPIIVNTYPYTNSHNSAYCYFNDNPAYPSPDVYYLVLPNENTAALDVSLCGSSFDTFLSVFDMDGNTITFNDDGTCDAQSEISFSTVGLDSVYVIVEGWGTESGDYDINITESILGTSSINNKKIAIFPNPASHSFIISNVNNSLISIYNIDGKIVKTIKNYQSNSINISNLSDGIYFIKIEQYDMISTKKLIIK